MPSLKELFFGKKSAEDAKSRLQFVLIHDRAEISPGLFEEIKNDIIKAISNRLNIDPSYISINMDEEAGDRRLLVDVPLKKTKRPVMNR
jgi:cell division topological specificity factor